MLGELWVAAGLEEQLLGAGGGLPLQRGGGGAWGDVSLRLETLTSRRGRFRFVGLFYVVVMSAEK